MYGKRILATLGLVALSACGGEAQQPAIAAPECPPGIAITDGWMALGAIAGDPAAVYFSIENSGEENLMIRTATVAGTSSATIHEMGTWNLQPSMDEVFQLDVPAGETVVFSPDTYHIMAMEPDQTLSVGGQTEVTLNMVTGGRCSFTAEVRGAGDAPE